MVIEGCSISETRNSLTSRTKRALETDKCPSFMYANRINAPGGRFQVGLSPESCFLVVFAKDKKMKY